MTGQLGRLQAPATGELIDLSERTGVKNLFVAQDHSLEQLLFDRTVVGSEFAKHCLDGSRFLIGCIDRAWLARPTTAELVLLSKGLAYQMSTAALLEVGVALPINLVATRRVDASSEDALIEIPYHRFDAGGSDLVIADTVASGASICRALDEYRLDHPVETITVLSFAGSLMGARRIERYCDAEGISACFVFALAAFGLADNGFDLSFLHAHNRGPCVRRAGRSAVWGPASVSRRLGLRIPVNGARQVRTTVVGRGRDMGHARSPAVRAPTRAGNLGGGETGGSGVPRSPPGPPDPREPRRLIVPLLSATFVWHERGPWQ